MRNGWFSTPNAKRVALGVAIAALALAFTVFKPAPTTGPYLRDFEAYWSAGVTWNSGGDPYARAIWIAERSVPGVDAARDELLPFIGPAAFRPLWSWLGRLPFPLASRVWAAVLIVAASTVAIGSVLLAGTERRALTAAASFAAIFAFAPCTSAIALGQAAIVAAAATVLAVAATQRSSLWGTGSAAFVAALQPNLALPLAALARDRRTIVALGIAVCVFAAATLAFGGGISGLAHYVHALARHGAAERDTVIQTTPTAIAWGFGASRSFARVTGIAIALAALGIALVAIRTIRFDRVEATAFVSAALPLVSPFFHEHDFAIAFLPAIVVARRCEGVWLAAGLAGTIAIGVDWLNFVQRPDSFAQHIAQAVALGAAILAIAARPTKRTAGIVAITIAAVTAIGVAAARYPAPVWPDNLPSGYRASPQADVSTQWHDEQVRSGLEQRVPAWAWLRIPALGGSVLVAFALAAHAARRPQQRPRNS